MKTAKSSSIADRMRMLRPKEIDLETHVLADVTRIAAPPPSETVPEVAAKAQLHCSNEAHLELIAKLGGEISTNPFGSFWVRRQVLAASLSHGPAALHHATQLDPRMLRRIEPRLIQFELSTALYLDTETTGLSGGSGTYPFMIGLAYFQKCPKTQELQCVIEQLMMSEYSQEKAMLFYLLQRCSLHTGLVSFNGKAFDAQLLDTRLCLHRFSERLEKIPHLDLLPLSRRLWSKALSDCRLETLETELLKLPRQGDIPGWMIPQTYFQFLQKNDARGLALVAEHNRRDMLAMVGLVAGLTQLANQPLAEEAIFLERLKPFEDLGLGKLFFRLGKPEATPLLQRALFTLPAGELVLQAGRLYARCLQRGRQFDEALDVWTTLVQKHPTQEQVYEGLAKLLEHRQKNYQAALETTRCAQSIPGISKYRQKCWKKRAERLEKKCQN